MSIIAFRVDASSMIGSGHLMRCLTLANALKMEGAEIYFISRHLLLPYQSLIQQAFTLHLLPTNKHMHHIETTQQSIYENWLGTTWEEDANDSCHILKTLSNVDLLVVDHYGIDARWETYVRSHVKKILVIDDLANRAHDCDSLLDQNYYYGKESRYEHLVPKNTLCLLGPQFALLRPEFQKARQLFPRLERTHLPVKRINICFGGVDAKGDTIKVLTMLKPWLDEKKLQIDVIVSSACSHIDVINEWVKQYSSIRLYISPPNLAELLALADIGIGAVGSMIWERACVGLPSITLAIAENQQQLAEDTARAGMHLFLGKSSSVSTEQLQAAISLLLNNSPLRQNFADNSLHLTDGQGTQRVVRQIKTPTIFLRQVSAEDRDNLFTWRNASINRQYSHDAREISYEQHQAWFEKILQAEDRFLLIGADQDGPIGVLRFDYKEKHWLTSIYLVPSRHGKGLGTALLKEGLMWLKSNCKGCITVHAEVQPENIASMIAFERAGFKRQFSTFTAEVNLL